MDLGPKTAKQKANTKSHLGASSSTMRIVTLLLLGLVPLSIAFQTPRTIQRRFRSTSRAPQVIQPWKLPWSVCFASSDDNAMVEPTDLVMLETSQTLDRISWLSWWAQSILTVVSSVTLLFARNVVRSSRTAAAAGSSGGGEGLLVAGTGLILSFLSILWTWGGARLSQRLIRKKLSKIHAAQMIRRAISVGIRINLLGMALAIVGAEQIVGSLAVKVLTTTAQGGLVMSTTAQPLLQPIDILVVQGNTNTILSHFSSLVALLYLTGLVKRLDPPSEEGDERNRK